MTGFTLVEMLIVIIIIGVLAGMMLLSSGAATDKAMAVRIISDVRTMKAAALMYKADYNSWPLWLYRGGDYVNLDKAGHEDVLPQKYFDVKPVGNGYWIGAMTFGGSQAFSVADLTSVDAGVKEAISAKAADNSLYGIDSVPISSFDASTAQKYNGHKYLVTILSN